MSPRLSVIIPVKNRRDLLARCLDGLVAQDHPSFEVVVVDDGSTDGSDAEALAREAAGRPVRLVRAGGNGAVEARRTGVAAARGQVLAFTDSDCIPQPGWLAAGAAAIDAGADVVQGVTRPARPPRPLERTVQVGRDDGIYATCNVFYRRSAYDAAGGFDAGAGQRLAFRPGRRGRGLGFGEDTLLGWRVRRAGQAGFAPDAVVEHAVFPPDPADSVRRAWMTGAFPALVRDVPELRSTALTGGIALGPCRLPLYGAAVALAARRRGLAVVLAAGWAAGHASHVSRVPGPWSRRALWLAGRLAVDGVTAAALVAGSARARTIVL